MTSTAHADLTVVGGGVAGIACAIAAADQGLHVVLAEKTDELGGAARWSAGNLLKLGVDTGLDHLRALSFHKTDDGVLASYAAGLHELPAWLESLGAVITQQPGSVEQCWPYAPGADEVVYYRVGNDGPAGPALLDVLLQALSSRVERGQVELVRGAAATALCLEASHAGGPASVVGVVLNTSVGTTRLHARSIALTTGGFENAPELCDAYLPVSAVRPLAQLANTGDGLRLAQSAGAALWHMSSFFGYWGLHVPGHLAAFAVRFAEPGHVLVDPRGHRFTAETGREVHDVLRDLGSTLPTRPHLPALPVIGIADQACLDAGPISRMPTPNTWTWSEDNRTEIEEGWIVGGGTVESLSPLLGIDAGVLRSTLERYNDFATHRHDDDFARPPSTMRPLDLERLYAVRLWPSVATTAGGPVRDAAARVLDWSNRPIPGLLAAGGNGSVWSHLTQHGGGLTDALVFGRIAAATAAAALHTSAAAP